jgi:hypothetical protein
MTETDETLTEESAKVEQPHSCKVAINAKGQYSGEVKVYAVTPEDALKKAKELAGKLEVTIKERNE